MFSGNPEDPSIVLVDEPGALDSFWADVEAALVKAGRRVIRFRVSRIASEEMIDLDLHKALSLLPARPAIIAARGRSSAVARLVARDAAPLVTGAVLIDPETGDQSLAAMAAQGGIPVLIATGATREQTSSVGPSELPDSSSVEAVEIGSEQPLSLSDRIDTFSAVLVDFLERRLPRTTPEYRLGSDARTLRDALGCFATGVTILTTLDASGAPVGLTANSFTSVSLDPPLLLACISATASSAVSFEGAAHFAVNVLHIGQQPASQRFARRGEDRFGETAWEPGLHGTPIISGSLATFECSRYAMHEGGDHLILVGQVDRARFEPTRDPLLYFKGKYRRLHFS
ncbi:flavin reductase family protein [Hyphomonas sp. WL0036]|nr:flavin reductase family protein [Hyphomonas sediminis]